MWIRKGTVLRITLIFHIHWYLSGISFVSRYSMFWEGLDITVHNLQLNCYKLLFILKPVCGKTNVPLVMVFWDLKWSILLPTPSYLGFFLVVLKKKIDWNVGWQIDFEMFLQFLRNIAKIYLQQKYLCSELCTRFYRKVH